MQKILKSPAKYVQGEGEFKKLYDHMKDMGTKVFFIISQSGLKRVGEDIEKGFAGTGMSCVFEELKGECSKGEVERLVNCAREAGCDVVAGVGGGKILDAAKAVSFYMEKPVAILPTVASTDAPCSALSILYKEDGEFDQYLFLQQSPQLVLVDESVIMKAPVRLLVAGMGDALATYYEARAVERSGKNTQVHAKPTVAARKLAAACYETLMKDGVKAKLAFENGSCSEAVKNVIETNTYLSGVGFESGGLGAAHAIQKGFTVLPELHHYYHGEKVAFGIIAQLVMENASMDEIMEVIDFCYNVGLPITLEDLGIGDLDRSRLFDAAAFSARPGMTSHNMPFEVTPESVYAGLLGADALGKQYKANGYQ